MSISKRVAVAGSTLCGMALVLTMTGQPALAAEGQEQLMPDSSAWCALNPPHQMEVNVLGWQVFSTGIQGTPNQNDWRCTYDVVVKIPTGYDKGRSFTLPPRSESIPVDWAAMCAGQYEGSTQQWAASPGPILSGAGPYGAPWNCLGAPGAHYDQTETPNGPVGRVS